MPNRSPNRETVKSRADEWHDPWERSRQNKKNSNNTRRDRSNSYSSSDSDSRSRSRSRSSNSTKSSYSYSSRSSSRYFSYHHKSLKILLYSNINNILDLVHQHQRKIDKIRLLEINLQQLAN